ncbi:TerC family protein [Cellvibrio japonicus]|uniref:Integral membrane protein TerC family superfamily n=1 Tax=Cellvibrio japonicus (strain Ueda107) TaxID=498211 RepID=B3PDT8_CELJU|nr:TerC family protein [Cellvibrio japonicus]ACE84237.1 Integral membrane protein TerC family superfamily [Cellvibrio japonicus Ueda107]QEI13426.1 TerC family protein [Cellvibrio japonicus]QEI17000.1 TerC family protein [Cellvibrio japonicus]QEI20578.1 TerC family protein [Cellvibrio japonicus]
MFEWIYSPEAWVALATLTALEIVLGIDNIIFISILVGRLPEHQRKFARTVGLGLAMLTRLALLFSLAWVMGLTDPLFSLFNHEVSGRDIILIGGGLFLIAKATHEIHGSLEGTPEEARSVTSNGLMMVLVQIAILDIVFSLDSVITAVGLVSQVPIMAIAIIIAVGVMLFAAKPIGDFVDDHPTIKILALSFLVVVGFTLMIEGFEVHVPKGYIYFAMAFSLGVEMINIKMRKNMQKPVELRKEYKEEINE